MSLKKRYCLEISGQNHTWLFEVLVDPKYIKEWRQDGIEISELCNTIPEWIVEAGLTKVWCFFQDIFHFKNPFAK